MSGAARRVLRSVEFADHGVPAGFDQNAVRGRTDVARGIADKSLRLQKSVEKFQKEVTKLQKSGIGADEATRKASKHLDDAAELVKQHAVEAKGEDPTVVADIAAALLTIDPGPRQMLLRRAGNPEIFSDLDGVELDQTDVEGAPAVSEFQKGASAASAKAEEKDLAKAETRESLPLRQRPASTLQQKGEVTKTGTPKDPSDIYKDHVRSPSALEVDTSERRRIIETQGPEAAAKIPLTTTQRGALNTLAGDQIKALKKIATIQRARLGMSESQFRKLKPEQQAAFDIQNLIGAYLPDVISEKEKLTFHPRDEVLRIGTGLGSGGFGSKSQKWGRGGVADRVVENRNNSQFENLQRLMYELTAPIAETDPRTGKVLLDASGNPVASQSRTSRINLNTQFPLHRARLGQARPDGTLEWPAEAMSPEFLTEFMQGVFNNHDPEFFTRMLPLIQRSLEYTPAYAGSKTVLIPGGDIQYGGGKRTRTAGKYDQMQFVPSDKFKRAMEEGVGSAKFPYPIYGTKQLDREPLGPPALTPEPTGIPGGNIDQDVMQQTRDRIEEMRKKLRGQTGTNDQASIYMVPDTSPLRTLLV